MPKVNPAVLLWARETAGIHPEAAAQKLDLKSSKGIPATERLKLLEQGKREPTRAMLAKMAKLYRRPLLTFYLSTPPKKGDRGEDFRALPADRPRAADAMLDALLRDIRARQSLVRATIEEDEDATALPFVDSMKAGNGPRAILFSIIKTLNISRDEYRAQKNAETAFDILRARAEAKGIFVLLIGNLGSYHTAFDLETFRGFALADKLAPFIVINDQDAKSAWSFTLLHELAHLWIGATGVSGSWSNTGVELLCNSVAAEFLISDGELAQITLDKDNLTKEDIPEISTFASDRNVSRTMVAYRLFVTGRISEKKWIALRNGFRADWLRNKELNRQREKEDDGGPSYYVVKRHRLGRAILEFAQRNLVEGDLTPSKAGKILGVKPRNVAPLLETINSEPG